MTDVWSGIDPLSDALHFFRMDRSALYLTKFTAPWALAMPAGCTNFYIVLEGQLQIETAEGVTPILTEGEMALVLHGAPYKLFHGQAEAVSPADTAHERISEKYRILRHGGGGELSRVLCCAVRFEHPAAAQLIRQVPEALCVRFDEVASLAWLQPLIKLMAAEARQLRPGWETVSARLADILIIQAIRAWIETAGASIGPGWLGALRDPQISHALALIHRHPERDWSLAELAEAAMMSRSVFAARFCELVGEPPMRYLTRWRMHAALQQIGRSDTGLGELAAGLGYRSEAAFHRAFKRFTGLTPGEARKRAALELSLRIQSP